MTDKELRRLSRRELLEMLIAQTEKNEKLKAQLEQYENQLQDRKIAIDQAGSLAEASLKLNGIFEAAEQAAQQYLENIQCLSARQETICSDIQAKAEQKANEIIQEAYEYSQRAHTEADAYWEKVKAQAIALLKDQDALRELVGSAGKDEQA